MKFWLPRPTKQQLMRQYPVAQGYRVLSEVDVYQGTRFASKVDWHKANPNASLTGYEEFGGKLWRKVTDIDIAVVKENANGKTEIVHLEQIKSGESDRAIDAQGQMDNSLAAMRNAGTVEAALRTQEKTILRNIV